jgi:tight adherence protein C
MNSLVTHGIVGVILCCLITWLILLLWPHVLPSSPVSGERGLHRKRALQKKGLFQFVEPIMRLLALKISALPAPRLRSKIEKTLVGAGRPLGLNGDEYLAISVLTFATGLVMGAGLSELIEKGFMAGGAIGGVVGGAMPWFKLDDELKRRRIIIGRNLPQAIDLVALSMRAGLDFPGALSEVTGQLGGNDPLKFEFEYILQKLALGWSRKDALEGFGERIPSTSVRQFVGSVCQAEKMGAPLVRVLSTQAEVMRTRRSQAAEETAARAAVLILGPLMLIFACVFIIIIGPMVIKYLRGDLF